MLTDNTKITMLGTGNAIVTRCFNTCFALRSPSTLLLVDAGGGNGVLSQLERAGIGLDAIHHLYLTHAHTDHVLGAVWIVRMVIQRMRKGAYTGTLTVYGHDRVLSVLQQICRLTLPAKLLEAFWHTVIFHELRDKDRFTVGDLQLQCFDILSTKEKQFGFRAQLPCGRVLVCLGDEPYNEANRSYVEHADWLMCEAFCLYKDRDVFKPYEKNHSTALDAGKLAARLDVANLLLYHTEDKHLATRKNDYAAEAARHFHGRVVVPDDLETVTVD